MKIIIVEDILKFNKRLIKNIEQVLIEENLDISIISYLKYNNSLKKLSIIGK